MNFVLPKRWKVLRFNKYCFGFIGGGGGGVERREGGLVRINFLCKRGQKGTKTPVTPHCIKASFFVVVAFFFTDMKSPLLVLPHVSEFNVHPFRSYTRTLINV